MEYLSLQDIPHRHRDPAYSHRMTSTNSSERPSANVTAANHMRSTPPMQVGEQSFPGRLPSFSEFLHTTSRAPTPPRTPSHRQDSTPKSPHVTPKFEDIAWTDPKHRRNDTLGDIYARTANNGELPSTDPRRMSVVVDPALSQYTQSQLAASGSSSQQHHHHHPHQEHSSVSYPLPPPPGAHSHQAASPESQAHAMYHMAPRPSPCQAPPQQSAASYNHRPSYYQDAQAAANTNSYDAGRRDSYYARPAYTGVPPTYEQGYPPQQYDIRFHQNVGVDQNTFTRKRRGNLPKESTNILKEWFNANRVSPYPTEEQKLMLCNRTCLNLNQVSNWFINARRRAPQKEAREREANKKA